MTFPFLVGRVSISLLDTLRKGLLRYPIPHLGKGLIMVFRNSLLAVVSGIVLLASPQFGFAQTTTIEVPQGTGVFPTIGQIKCLEELGSGRFCAATYECSDDSGELWGDLANHNGRRAIGATSPVANQRDCVITVDGKASVRWLTGYRPEGRTGELVGLTTSADALRPVVRTTGTGNGDGGRNLLHYILERHDTTLAEVAEFSCGDYRRETVSYANCVHHQLRNTNHYFLGGSGYTAGVSSYQENELTRCLVTQYENYCRWFKDLHSTDANCDDGVPLALYLIGSAGGRRTYTAGEALSHSESRYDYSGFNVESGFPCRDFAEEHLATLGIEVRYCDECDNPNEYRLAIAQANGDP